MSQVLSGVTGGFRRDALSGVRTRRIFAVAIDFVIVGLLASAIWIALLILTLGFSFLVLPPLFPLVAFFYNGLSVSGRAMATPGMRALDLEMRMQSDGRPVPFINAAAHAILFYVSWCFPIVFVVSLVDSEKRCLHDLLAGVLVTRRL